MSEFADFTVQGDRIVRLPVAITPLARSSIPACAQLAATREGDATEQWIESFERSLGDDDHLVLVAHSGRGVVGYGKATRLELPHETNAPSGWYLTGIVVDPVVRRRGVGAALTQARITELQRRGVHNIWFFANARNQVSLALHEQLGFREVSRDFTIPGVTFDCGHGVLARWEAPAH